MNLIFFGIFFFLPFFQERARLFFVKILSKCYDEVRGTFVTNSNTSSRKEARCKKSVIIIHPSQH